MDPALVLLLRLRLWGWLRNAARKLGTARGLLLTGVGMMLFLPSILAVFLNPRQPPVDPGIEGFRRFGPAFFLIYCLSTLLFSPGDKAFAFSPAEISFLFPAPFTRRKLLAYKIGGNIALVFLMSIFMTFAFRYSMKIWIAGYLGLVLAFSFLQLFAMAVTLAGQAIGARASTRRRQLGLVVIAALVVGTFLTMGWQSLVGKTFPEMLNTLENAPAVRVALAPFRPFIMAISARHLWPDFVSWAAVALTIDVVLVAAILSLDAQYLEAAAASSERFYAKLERMRKGGPSVSSRNPNKVWKAVPNLPWWGGVGPILWRQLTTAYRDFARVLFAPCLTLTLAGLGIYASTGLSQGPGSANEPLLPLVFGGLILGSTVLMTPLVSFDFRSDFERMEGLKTLPLSAMQVVMGQLATPAVILCGSQLLGFAVLMVGTWPVSPVLGALAAFTIPLNLVMLEVENVMFLWFPAAPVAHTPGDIQAMGRMMVLMMAKLVTLALVTALAFGFGMLAYLVGGWAAMAVVSWLGMIGFAIGFLPLIAGAFRGFDVASDTPS